MKSRKKKSSIPDGVNRNRFAVVAQAFVAAMREVGSRIVKANRFIKESRQMRGRDVESLSIVQDFRPKGRLYRCFMSCCDSLDSVCMCDARLLRDIKQKLNWFEDELNIYFRGERVEDVARFTTLVDRMLDMVEPSSRSEIIEEKESISKLGKRALERLNLDAKVHEAQLRLPSRPKILYETPSNIMSGKEDLREEVKQDLRRLVQQLMADDPRVHKIAEAVEVIMSATPGVSYYSRAKRIKETVGSYKWSIATIRQYAKDIGKYHVSRQGALIQAAKRRKKKLIERDLRDGVP